MRRALTLLGFIAVLLAVDTQVDARAQLLLGLAAWIALALALRAVPPLLRAQALVVVVVATCAEVVGSIIWGVYTYRLENLPSFVPPCHGLVYLAGAAIADLLRDIADDLAELEQAKSLTDRLDRVLATVACHGAVRSGRRLAGR